LSAWKNRGFAARLRCALQGFAHALSAEHSLRAQGLAFLGVLGALVLLRPNALWWALLLLASTGVLAAELLNTAIERLADALHPADSPAIRAVKDCAAAGVLLAVLGALAVGAAFLVHLLGAAA
jgi:diacylglycerol kinase (ATP)